MARSTVRRVDIEPRHPRRKALNKDVEHCTARIGALRTPSPTRLSWREPRDEFGSRPHGLTLLPDRPREDVETVLHAIVRPEMVTLFGLARRTARQIEKASFYGMSARPIALAIGQSVIWQRSTGLAEGGGRGAEDLD